MLSKQISKLPILTKGLDSFKHLSKAAPLYFFASSTSKNDSFISPDQPKWMRFFIGRAGIKTDIDRAIKCENLDLLNNYVKTNCDTMGY